MNKPYILILFILISIPKFVSAQIICIKCYDQNDSISIGVNNLLLNGGFENNTCTPGWVNAPVWCPNSNNYSCDIANWTCTGGASSTYTSMFDTSWTAIAEGNVAAYFGNGFGHACSLLPDDTLCIHNILCTLSGNPPGFPMNDTNFGGTAGVSLKQTVTSLTVGNIYVLEFWAGGESDFGTLSKNGVFAVDVGFGDTLLEMKPTPPFTGIGTTYIIEFRATSSFHTIKFTNWGHTCSICTELVLDNVRLYTLGELSPSVPSCTSGINNPGIENFEYLIYPNPAVSKFTVETNRNELSEIILYDIVSRKILQRKFSNSCSVNIEKLEKGIYFYELKSYPETSGEIIKKGKVVKE